MQTTKTAKHRAEDTVPAIPFPENGKKSSPLSILLIVILSICAAPIAAPLAIAALMMLLAGVIVVLAVILCIFVCSISAVIAGVYSVIRRLSSACRLLSPAFWSSPEPACFPQDLGFCFLSPALSSSRWLVVALARFIQKRIDKRREKR